MGKNILIEKRHNGVSFLFYGLSVVSSILVLVFIGAAYASASDWVSQEDAQIYARSASYEEANAQVRSGCDMQKSLFRVSETPSVFEGCVFNGKYAKLAFISSYNNYVSFSGDSSYYPVNNFGGSYDLHGSAIIPDTDIVIAREYADWQSSYLRIYKNAASRFKKLEASTSYYFNRDEPEYELKDVNGNLLHIKWVGFSSNGKWVVAEAEGSRIILINTDTYLTKQIYRGYGSFSQLSELRVSDDGRYVAVAAYNGSLRIIKVDDVCGSNSLQPINDQVYTEESCVEKYFDNLIDNKIGGHTRGLNLHFDEGGGKLSFYMLSVPDSNGNEYRYLTLTVPGYSTYNNMDYLALGDSYSSGEGDTEVNAGGKKYYRNGTDKNGSEGEPKEKCHISTRSYPYILATGMALGSPLSLPSTKWQSVACSAATAWDIKNKSSSDYKGQSDRLEGFDANRLKQTALNEFMPGRQKQIEFVKRYKPRAVTLTMGGNDIGFGAKMLECAWIDTCSWTTDAGKKKLAREISDQYDNLKSLYEELYSASEKSTKIYVVGYPQFINGDPKGSCSDKNIGALNATERSMIYSAVTYLNNTIKKAASAAGVKYIDIEQSLDGHKLCDGGTKYVTGVTNLIGINKNEIQESFHPNAKGHHEMAMSIWDKIGNESLLTYQWCQNTTMQACADPDATKETVTAPEYFPEKEESRIENRSFMPDRVKQGASVSISLPAYSVSPNKSLQVSVLSTGAPLASPISSQDGSLNVVIEMPEIQPGLTTVVIEGETYSGEPISLEQGVIVEGANPNDIDGDGANDVNDKCLFVAPINKDEDQDGIDDGCDPEIGTAPVASPSPTPSPSPSVTPSPSPSPSPSVTPSPSPTPAPGNTTQTPKNSAIQAIVTTVKKVVAAVKKIVVTIVSVLKSLFR